MIQQLNNKFPISIQKQLGWLFFFLAWPVLAVGVNFTFFIFLFIVYNVYSLKGYGSPIAINDFADKVIFLFIIWALFCSITQPFFERNPGFFADFKFNIQHIYWMVLFLFIKNNFNRIDFAIIGKYTFWGSIFLILTFYFLPMKVDFGLGSINTMMGRNSFVYQVECLVPIALLSFRNQTTKVKLTIMIFYLLTVLLTNGRAGTLIIFIYFIGYFLIENIADRKALLPILIIFFALIYIGAFTSRSLLVSASNLIRPFNDRVANLMIQEKDGDLEFDRSWIERQIHIKKGLEIFDEYPIKGVGLNHFMYYDSDYSSVNLDDYIIGDMVRINELTLEEFNKRSAHNSYIQLLAETGFVGLGLYILFLVPIVFYSIKHFIQGTLEIKDLLLLAVICVSAHNWAISSYSSAITFALFGLGYGRLKEIYAKR